ncbi:hypothetical protein DFQ01_103442 [Paenibacillus cellulosilyticus]|uniref:Uncharacterized protein n=1 Tax=Paenibacillus cellulosilyticus TaxID=375489 RepID=A0A2V2YXI3_9BACL|nr:hypothetical protein DFQ01_103442 [Paenibacillus cellulosilyticus]
MKAVPNRVSFFVVQSVLFRLGLPSGIAILAELGLEGGRGPPV